MTQFIHLKEGGEAASLGMTEAFPERPSFPPEISHSKLSAWGQPEGLLGSGEKAA